jgi:hypothetical protein
MPLIFMAISGTLGIGLVLVGLGVVGLAYAMPLVAAPETAKDERNVFVQNNPVKATSDLRPYLGIEIGSAAMLVGGIALSAAGQVDSIGPRKKESKGLGLKKDKAGTAAAA